MSGTKAHQTQTSRTGGCLCGEGLWFQLRDDDADYIVSPGQHERLTGPEFEATLNANPEGVSHDPA